RHGARDAPRFVADLGGLSPQLGAQTLGADSATVRRSMHFQAVALRLAGGFAALSIGLVVVQLLAREAVEEADGDATMRALGMTRAGLFVSRMIRAGAVALTAGAAAVALAALLSPVLPLGTARVAEPHNGFSMDATALAVGGVGLVMV